MLIGLLAHSEFKRLYEIKLILYFRHSHLYPSSLFPFHTDMTFVKYSLPLPFSENSTALVKQTAKYGCYFYNSSNSTECVSNIQNYKRNAAGMQFSEIFYRRL